MLFSATFPVDVRNFKEKYMSNAVMKNLMEELTLFGITQSTVNGLINGTSQNPKLLTIVRLCYGLDMPLKDFFDDEVFIDIDDE